MVVDDVLQAGIEGNNLPLLILYHYTIKISDHYLKNGSTYFSWAVRKSNLETVKYLINFANVNLREKNGATPLLLAIHLNRPEVVKCLIDNEVDVTEGDAYDTPLTAAVQQGHLDIIELLINAGTSTTGCDIRGTPPLIIAIKQNKLGIVEFFLRRKLGTDIIDSDKNTPLIAAIRNNSSIDIVRSLLKYGVDPNETKCGTLPLIWAINSGNSEFVKILLDNGADVNRPVLSKDTLLTLVIKNKIPVDTVECLLEQNIDVNETKNDKTPLSWAVTTGDCEVVKLLLSYGADLNVVNPDGNTPLATAVQCKQSQIAKYLLENDAMVGKSGTTGNTPLLWAVLNEDLEMIKLLLDYGADYIINKVILDAIETRNLQVVQLLNERQSLIQVDTQGMGEMTPLKRSLEIDDLEIARNLINNGAKVVDDLQEKETCWIIHFLQRDNTEMVKLLTGSGARLDELADCGDTVLTYSMKNGNFDMVKYFLAQGADINQPSRDGDTVLLKSVEDGKFDMVKYFLAQGANVNQANGRGSTPLAAAASNEDFKTFQYLVDCGASLSEDDQRNNPNLLRYYQIAQKKTAKEEKQNRERRHDASNQKAA